MELGFYKPTVPQYNTLPFAELQHMQQCQVRVPTVFITALIQMNKEREIVSRAWVRIHDRQDFANLTLLTFDSFNN